MFLWNPICSTTTALISEYATIMEPHLFYNYQNMQPLWNPICSTTTALISEYATQLKTQQFSLIISWFSHVSCVQVKNFLKQIWVCMTANQKKQGQKKRQ